MKKHMIKVIIIFTIILNFSLYAKDNQSQELINNAIKSLESQNCKLLYTLLSDNDKRNKSMNDFCFEFSKGIKRLENYKFTGKIYNIKDNIAQMKLMAIDNKTFKSDSITWDVIKENKKWFIYLKFKSKKEDEQSKKNLERIVKLQGILIYSFEDKVIYNYDKKLKLLNEYLELLKIENYGKDYEEKAKKIIKNTLIAKSIDKESIKIINSTISIAKYDGYGFFAEIQNKSEEVLSTIIIKLYLLDNDNNPIYDKEYKVYDIKPNYVKKIGRKIEIPSIWDKEKNNFKVLVEYIEINSN